ncbi:hypothetical protein COU20_02420 [Candidatus Kaiserbacteria bacterium CG10_big_fil_rev_8_21_14_0_10_59_10]|uniref:Uncharacterized protein n=1 Tax=Candidatus Kaiserbacteria bacterium CG10_big_fil_rev_8_21_14_0_10_59_10 TaxID=1974612 RepID=A0A2H0U7S2_9BACT|nr:MAG: hypothetical protein COU20_02420 [Candidatus Kaiserbacteria bacterium CG10_big_fil_rev_8_21_14_0_10_59_10]
MEKGEEIIVVTGGAGFIGARLCARLAGEGKRVISLDNYFAGSRANHVAGVEYREGHTKDIEKHIPETPGIIYHLGEYARVEQSVLEPDAVHDLNVVGTGAVLEFWKKRGCKLVYAGSSTKFGDGGLARERTPYASTKAANTERVNECGERHGLPYAIAYFYNVYGPGERAGLYGTVIEVFKQMYLAGAPIAVTAPGTQTRNFTHVDDIVDGLLLIGERGQGDEYGLGAERAYSIREVAELFGGEIIMLPARGGNRMSSGLDTAKSRALGWQPKRALDAYIAEFVSTHSRGASREKRVLVFSTTFYPTVGLAEEALLALARAMPDVTFDVVTTVFTPSARGIAPPSPNVHIHRVGFGGALDKFFLPLLGYWKARRLHRAHRYLFAWSLLASYAALAGVLLKRYARLPLLITLADHDLDDVSRFKRGLIATVLSDADQVYGTSAAQERRAGDITAGALRRHSMGEGDAFANQLRYAYAEVLLHKGKTQ